jgi:hypothetical protein
MLRLGVEPAKENTDGVRLEAWVQFKRTTSATQGSDDGFVRSVVNPHIDEVIRLACDLDFPVWMDSVLANRCSTDAEIVEGPDGLE